MIRTIMVAALALACVASNAEARPKNRAKPVQAECFIFCPGVGSEGVSFGEEISRKPLRHSHFLRDPKREGITHQTTVLAHPRGCPRRAFCGCGASIRVFGRSIRKLWLARNWFSFPRTSPAPGMVAVRRHHVFVLERHLGGSTWLSYDANSGRGLTRLHPRSIAGFAIVNPHGSLASRGQAL